MRKSVFLALLFALAICLYQTSLWAESTAGADEDDYVDVEFKTVFTSDPIQPYNRAIFTFNDKLYYYGFKPVTTGYKAIMPEPARRSVANFFTNLKMPRRLFNCLLQGKIQGAGTETARFLVNSTFGVIGFFDPAKKYFNLEPVDEDFGQTLGHYNAGPGSYIVWPFIGPSNVRDTFGFIGDMALDPLFWISFTTSGYVTTGVSAYDKVNDVSLDKGEAYEKLTEAAIDPYISIQDAYIHHRVKLINE